MNKSHVNQWSEPESIWRYPRPRTRKRSVRKTLLPSSIRVQLFIPWSKTSFEETSLYSARHRRRGATDGVKCTMAVSQPPWVGENPNRGSFTFSHRSEGPVCWEPRSIKGTLFSAWSRFHDAACFACYTNSPKFRLFDVCCPRPINLSFFLFFIIVFKHEVTFIVIPPSPTFQKWRILLPADMTRGWLNAKYQTIITNRRTEIGHSDQ